jgi:MGT family glycosyltransferase
MERRHIAVFTPLVAAHVYPVLEVCSELVRRGYRVTYPTDDRFAPSIRETGAEAVVFKPAEFNYPKKLVPHPLSDDSNFWRLFASVFGPQIIARETAAVAELEGFYATNPPDLILYEWFSFAGRIIARHLSCPAIQVCAHFAHHDGLIRVDGNGATPEPLLEFAKLLDSFMSTLGLEGERHLWHVEKMNIFFIPKEFQYDVDSFDTRFKFVGATHRRKPRVPVWKNRAEKRRPLLLISETTSTTDDTFLKLCVEVFAESKYDVVFSQRPNSAEVSSTRLPDNFEINREALNCEILPFADVMLCQGGMGATLESLYYGVPIVAVPLTPWQSEVAYRIAELGLGLHVPERGMTPSSLKEAVDMATSDEALLGRVRRMQDNLRSNPGAHAAANAIEEFLAQPSSSGWK